MLQIFTHLRQLAVEQPWAVLAGALFITAVVHLFSTRVERFFYAHQWFVGYIFLRSLYLPLLVYTWGKEIFHWMHAYDRLHASLNRAPGEIMMLQQLLWLALGVSIAMRFVHVMDEVMNLGFLKKTRLQFYLIRFGARMLHIALLIFFGFWAVHILELPISGTLSRAAVLIIAWLVILVVVYFLYTLERTLREKMMIEGRFYLGLALLQKCILPLIFLLMSTISLFSMQESRLISLETTYLGYREIVQIAFFWTLFRLTGLFEIQLLSDSFGGTAAHKTMIQATGNVTRLGLSVVLIIVLMTKMGYSVSGVVTLLSGASFGLSFAARDIVANYLSGVVMYFEGQFSVGDWIYSADKGGESHIEGIIEYIGIRTTSIRTFDKRLLLVPNSFFSSKSIVNASKMTNRRILKKIPLGWLNDMETLEKIVQDIRLLVYNHPGIDKRTFLPMVHFTDFGTTELIITIYALTKTRNRHTFMNVQENILREVKSIIEKYGGNPPVDLMHILQKHHF